MNQFVVAVVDTAEVEMFDDDDDGDDDGDVDNDVVDEDD